MYIWFIKDEDQEEADKDDEIKCTNNITTDDSVAGTSYQDNSKKV